MKFKIHQISTDFVYRNSKFIRFLPTLSTEIYRNLWSSPTDSTRNNWYQEKKEKEEKKKKKKKKEVRRYQKKEKKEGRR